MSARMMAVSGDVLSADNLPCDLFDMPFDIDALSADWLADCADPHYAQLPCYVPVIVDDGLDPSVIKIEPASCFERIASQPAKT